MKKFFVVFSVILVAVLSVIFNKYDLDISIYLTKFNNGFCEFLDDYGEFPIYIGPLLFGTIYYFLSNKLIYKYISSFIAFVASLVATFKFVTNQDIVLNLETISLILVIAILITLITMFIFSKIDEKHLHKIKDIAFLGLLVSLISFAMTGAVKYLWGRVRFRDLSSDYSEFTSLFTINGITGHKSFPSGHTNAATSILILALIVPRFSDKKWLKYLVTSLCFIYILVLAVSRIIVSAHYASDVLFGFLIGFTTICVTHVILRRKGVINASNNKC